MKLTQLKLLLTGLAAGDSLGATSEFVRPADVPGVIDKYRDGYGQMTWPLRIVGGGTFGWKAGEPTDDTDMAMCMVRSFLAKGEFNPVDIADRFVAWRNTGPRDIGGTTSRVLGEIAAGKPWHDAGRDAYRRDQRNAPNGSIMRNGVIPAMADDLVDAYTLTLQHSIITHYHPLCVLCCSLHSWLIWRLLEEREWPFEEDGWYAEFFDGWQDWLASCDDPYVQGWYAEVSHDGKDGLADAAQTLADVNWSPYGPDAFNVFAISSGIGFVLTTLRTAVWALAWSIMDDEPFPVDLLPPGMPHEVFWRRGADTLAWVVLGGNDADTTGATAGPLLAAAHDMPDYFTDGLMAVEELTSLIETRSSPARD